MKNFIYWFPVFLTFLLPGCKSGDDTVANNGDDAAEETVALKISLSDYLASSSGEEKEVLLVAGEDWTISVSSDDDWCTVTPSDGSAGKITLKIKTTKNLSGQERDAIITVTCGDEKKTIAISQPVEKKVSIMSNGWDIYTAGTYRYGPSIIINDDGSIDAWFAATGGSFGGEYSLTTGEGSHEADPIFSDVVVGQKFTADVPFWGVNVQCPNWGGQHCGFTFCLYSWNTNYQTTIDSDPIASKTFVDYSDNSYVGVYDDDKFAEGDYLWILKDGLTKTSGVWKYNGSKEGVTNYHNGSECSDSYQARYLPSKTCGAVFWDQASYQHSINGGATWTKEKMVLIPTEGSRDSYSVCDPGVAKWGDYYYIGYTSTENTKGLDNHAYVCRSKNCEGPWEKWNGEGWGGNPQPVIEYTGDPEKWGVGEPSIVVVDKTIYFYYSWNCGNEGETTTTRVSTANVDDPDWPKNMVYGGIAINKSNLSGADHCDVKYDEHSKKFLAINTASRMTKDSYIVLWESEDGITFKKAEYLRDNLMPYLHNCGWSGDINGHIKEGVQQYISYSYGSSWGKWNTRWVPIVVNY